MTVLALERYPVEPRGAADFEALVSKLVEGMRIASGVLWADASRAFDDDPSYVVLSEWRTAADLDAWESGDNTRAFIDAADVHLRAEPTRRRFDGV